MNFEQIFRKYSSPPESLEDRITVSSLREGERDWEMSVQGGSATKEFVATYSTRE